MYQILSKTKENCLYKNLDNAQANVSYCGCVHSFTSGKDDVCTNGYYWYHCLPKVLLVASEL